MDDAHVFEEGKRWLPSHVLEEACGTKVRHCQQNFMLLHQQKLRSGIKTAALENQKQLLRNKIKAAASQHPKASCRSYQRPKLANGGPGMQAIFLESGQRPSGTGVFLPQAAKNFQSSKKPACAPVLLPARVVQALNLNVHALGLQISPQQDNPRPRGGYEITNINSTKDAFKRAGRVIYRDENSSPDIFLPKEWTY
ncbi:hypothetical protein L6164_034559 [Bauhinia variegata]|uniref:Uncharacterized protein n=1 Tax=Bauhinia variegata TaxID=167791 RepID=A0ACB9KVN8_BAUVA|nr:hypothetical protein L6164_034559 [Bauhinia variegata]